MAVISALYVALTYLIAPIAYGPIQFRVSEALVILVAARRHLILFVPVGCVVANLLSPYAGVWDLVFMPIMSTVGALPLFILGRRLLLVTSWFYGLVTGLSVAFMISIVEKSGFLVLALSITTSQVIIMTAGWLFFSGYLMLFEAGGGRRDRDGPPAA
ncbi:MAG: QueT transporter family protein [Deltaproteobacteria bacterium]|nr:QueT transporter family protein [Candidatus Zymogenaceae bacterium]